MRKLATGVWQLRGFPRDMFNIYLIDDVLVDAGTRWAKHRILLQLGKRPLRLVALTHCHPDHQGAARTICAHFGVPLACHEAEVPSVEGRAPMVPGNRIVALGARFWAGPPCRVGQVLREGDMVAGFRVIHTPGHTPGHIVFFRDADRVAIAGDIVANINFLTRKPGLREPPSMFSADSVQNRRSLQTLAGLQPSLVCFGHGPPLRDPDLLLRFAQQRA